ncbi:MAG: HAMP domain-containing protein, partial [Lentisphaeria bacterium]|nr:HAMP domain-containing protein [Lentisphaeria bacterium]
RDMSLRLKITIVFIVIVMAGTALSIAIGSRIVTDAMQGEARARVRTGLVTARMIYDLRQSRVRRSVKCCGRSERLFRAVGSGTRARLLATLEMLLGKQNSLDFVGVVDGQGQRVTALGKRASKITQESLDRVLRGLGAVDHSVSTEILGADSLGQEKAALVQGTGVSIGALPETRSGQGDSLDRSLVFFCVEPIKTERGVVGRVYGGMLINGSKSLVNQARDVVFGANSQAERKTGMVSIFLGDVGVSSAAMTQADSTLGARVSREVAKTVLEQRQPWLGRELVGDSWLVRAYEPIYNSQRHVVGMLQVGVREARYLQVRTRMMLLFLVVASIGLLILLGLIYVIVRTMMRPLEEMVAATEMIADGELDHLVHVTAHDEIGALGTAFNAMVGSLKRAREELEQWTQTLEQRVIERSEKLAQIQARMSQAQKLASLGRMAAGVAHEINNPLGGILTFAALGQDDLPDEHPQHRNFEIIYQQTLRCREIVKGLLEFSRNSDANPVPTNLNEIVERTLVLLERQALFHNIRAVTTLGADLPDVLIDPGQLQEVALNLIINAVDAMEGDGELQVRTACDSERGVVLLEVIDSGKGISAEMLPMIFEPFFTSKEVGQGTGLGLSIVHGIVTRAGGQIDVVSSPAGSHFTVSCPPVVCGQEEEGSDASG